MHTPDPLLRDLTAYVMGDEARHVAYGVLSLRDYYRDQPEAMRQEREDFVYEAARLMRNRFLFQEVWEKVGLPVQQCMDIALHNQGQVMFRQPVAEDRPGDEKVICCPIASAGASPSWASCTSRPRRIRSPSSSARSRPRPGAPRPDVVGWRHALRRRRRRPRRPRKPRRVQARRPRAAAAPSTRSTSARRAPSTPTARWSSWPAAMAATAAGSPGCAGTSPPRSTPAPPPRAATPRAR